MPHRKRSHRKHKRHSRRKVGAASLHPRSPLVMLGSLAAGYFLGDKINAQIDKLIPAPAPVPTATIPATAVVPSTSMMSYAPMAIELGLGGYLLLSKGKASLLKTIPGGLLAGAGLKRALKKFGIVSGYQSVPVIGRRHMAGYQSVPVIGGVPAQLQGIPRQLEGYRVNGIGETGYIPHGSGPGFGVMGSLNDYNFNELAMNASGSGLLNKDNASAYMSG